MENTAKVKLTVSDIITYGDRKRMIILKPNDSFTNVFWCNTDIHLHIKDAGVKFEAGDYFVNFTKVEEPKP